VFKKKDVSVNILTGLFCLLFLAAAQSAELRPAEEILRSFVEDFRSDPAAAEPITFGIRIMGEGGGEWHILVGGKKGGAGSFQVELGRGLPPNPSAFYTLDLATLRKIESAEINALTAMGRARASDPAPMDIELMEGFEPEAEFFGRFIPFTFHFWTRGFPEIVSFGRPHSREVHGARMVVFYYQKGLRSAWALIEKGQHVNRDPKDQTNPFPTMIIGIRGKAVAKVGGREVTMQAGQMAFVPAGVSHEAWNPYDEPAEVIILMFGEGA
jgi:mannose-6-phosphate isomerase-like protein (cupin superfamily)